MSDYNQQTVVTFVSANAASSGALDSDGNLTLEQEDSSLNKEECIEAKLADKAKPYSIDDYIAAANECDPYCNEDGAFKTAVLVTVTPTDLNYKLELTYGELGEKTRVEDNYAESFKMSLDDSYKCGVNFSNTPSAGWEGNVYGATGDLIKPPRIEYNPDNNTFSWGTPVVGTLRITGMRLYDRWEISIPARTDSVDESAYQSTVMAFWNASVTQLDLQIPPKEGNCYRETVVFPDGPEPETPPDEQCYRLTYWIDLCKGDVVETEEEQITCPESSS